MPDPDNCYSNGSYNEFFDYASRFYKDQAIASATDQMFKNHIDTILYRRNTVNGKTYAEDPVIMGKLVNI
jgi:mannan endo-1,4-beta-mannosidase